MNRLYLSVVAAALILGLAACGGASTTSSKPASSSAPGATSAPAGSSSPAQPAGTQVITYNPWTASGNLASGISATSTQAGSCFSNSSAAVESDAYRCLLSTTTSNGTPLYDPCYSDPSSGAGEVACPDMPNPDSVTIIKLTSALPTAGTTPASLVPWLLVLANGQRCNTNTGTVSTLGGINANYECDDGNAYGEPDESSATWTITYAPNGATASAMTKVAITTAYQ
jgi:hypothetical protein